jgi:hypothetical protein
MVKLIPPSKVPTTYYKATADEIFELITGTKHLTEFNDENRVATFTLRELCTAIEQAHNNSVAINKPHYVNLIISGYESDRINKLNNDNTIQIPIVKPVNMG